MWVGLLGAAMHPNNLPLQPIEKRDLQLNSSVKIHAGYCGTKLKLLFGHNLSQPVSWILLSMNSFSVASIVFQQLVLSNGISLQCALSENGT